MSFRTKLSSKLFARAPTRLGLNLIAARYCADTILFDALHHMLRSLRYFQINHLNSSTTVNFSFSVSVLFFAEE